MSVGDKLSEQNQKLVNDELEKEVNTNSIANQSPQMGDESIERMQIEHENEKGMRKHIGSVIESEFWKE